MWFETAVSLIWVAGAVVVIVVLPDCFVIGVGWCGWAASYHGGSRQLKVSSWLTMRFIPSMSASDMAIR